MPKAAVLCLLLLSLAALPPALPRAAELELLMVRTDGCTWCAAWEREVGRIYPKTPEAARAPLRRIDLADVQPGTLGLAAGVAYTPTFVLRRAGQEVGRITGYPGEAAFWALLGEMLEGIEPPTPTPSSTTREEPS